MPFEIGLGASIGGNYIFYIPLAWPQASSRGLFYMEETTHERNPDTHTAHRAPAAQGRYQRLDRLGPGVLRFLHLRHGCGADLSADRSEERRVGKECRSRWSP